jgi:hypothetical protein
VVTLQAAYAFCSLWSAIRGSRSLDESILRVA